MRRRCDRRLVHSVNGPPGYAHETCPRRLARPPAAGCTVAEGTHVSVRPRLLVTTVNVNLMTSVHGKGMAQGCRLGAGTRISQHYDFGLDLNSAACDGNNQQRRVRVEMREPECRNPSGTCARTKRTRLDAISRDGAIETLQTLARERGGISLTSGSHRGAQPPLLPPCANQPRLCSPAEEKSLSRSQWASWIP